jgi:hypothetical protein
MIKSFNNWSKVNNFNLEKVVDLVLTNGSVDTIKPDIWLLERMGNSNKSLSVLDFGCGIGRNIFQFSIKRPEWRFVGYDNISMIEKAKEYSHKKFDKDFSEYLNLEFTTDWEIIKNIKFDCIYATIVFQHIYEKDINLYVQDIKKMTNRLIVSGRRFNDDSINGKHKNTWQILENNGLYPSNAKEVNYKIDGDPDDHITCIYDF